MWIDYAARVVAAASENNSSQQMQSCPVTEPVNNMGQFQDQVVEADMQEIAKFKIRYFAPFSDTNAILILKLKIREIIWESSFS